MGDVAILKMGNPLLRQRVAEVEVFDDTIGEFAEQLMHVQKMTEGAGFAAPQMGVALRVIAFGGETKRYAQSEGTHQRVLINPFFEPLSNERIEGWEGCVSIPGIRGRVSRFKEIHYYGYDVDGKAVEGRASGFLSRVIQHECDHLNGVLFPERIEDMRYLSYEDEMTSYEVAL